jgi:hypothetical protein
MALKSLAPIASRLSVILFTLWINGDSPVANYPRKEGLAMARTLAEFPKGSRLGDFISLGVIAKWFPREQVDAVLPPPAP